MILNEDYRFRDDIRADTLPVELTLKPYHGVVLRYTSIRVVEETKDVAPTIHFGYELMEMGDHTEYSLRTDKVFQEYIGLILNTMIIEAVAADGDDIGSELREDDSSEPTEE